MEFSNQLPNFDINIFDDEQNERIDGRFVPMTDSEVMENANTKRKTLYDINFVKQFLTEHGERRSIEEIPAVEINNYLSKFVFAARTKKAKGTNHLHLEEFCRVLSATYVAPVMGNLQQHNRVYKVISLRHIHRLQPLKTHSKQCFKVIISLEAFSISIWHRLKILSQVQNSD